MLRTEKSGRLTLHFSDTVRLDGRSGRAPASQTVQRVCSRSRWSCGTVVLRQKGVEVCLLVVRSEQTDFHRSRDSLRPAANSKFAINAAEVRFDGVLADEELARQFLVGVPLGQEAKNLGLPLAES